jgi:hypothetical protein
MPQGSRYAAAQRATDYLPGKGSVEIAVRIGDHGGLGTASRREFARQRHRIDRANRWVIVAFGWSGCSSRWRRASFFARMAELSDVYAGGPASESAGRCTISRRR